MRDDLYERRFDADPLDERLVEPEALLASQVEGRLCLDTPERRLCFYVLVDAISALDSVRPLRRIEARQWTEGESIAWSSFAWCCDLFGLDAGAVRDAVLSGGGAR